MLATIVFVCCVSANEPEIAWSKTFGGADKDMGNSVHQTSDGGYIIAGETESFGAGYRDVYLVKTDENGNEEWSKTFGGADEDMGNSVQQTLDDGYIIVGLTRSPGAGHADVYLIKTDENGNEEWNKTFGGQKTDFGYSLQQTSDGGYIITGITSSFGAGYADVYLVKTDENGNEEWSKTFGGKSADYGFSGQQTSDGGYILAGWTTSFGTGDVDIYLVKTDETGNEEWSKTFGGAGYDECQSVQQTLDGGYIIAGLTHSFGAGGDVYLIKTDENGNEVWSKIFGGSAVDYCYQVKQIPEGGYIIIGTTYSFGAGGKDIYFMKTDSDGNVEWTRTFGGSDQDEGLSVQQVSDGGYIIAGLTVSFGAGDKDVWLIKAGGEPPNQTPDFTPVKTPTATATATPTLAPTLGLTPTPTPTPTVTSSVKPTPSPTLENVPVLSGYEAIFAISGLLTVLYLLGRKK